MRAEIDVPRVAFGYTAAPVGSPTFVYPRCIFADGGLGWRSNASNVTSNGAVIVEYSLLDRRKSGIPLRPSVVRILRAMANDMRCREYPPPRTRLVEISAPFRGDARSISNA